MDETSTADTLNGFSWWKESEPFDQTKILLILLALIAQRDTR